MLHAAVLFVVISGGEADGTREVLIDDAQVKLISEVNVPASEAGVLASLGLKEGDLVQAGQKMGMIDDRLARIDQRLAALEHEIAKLQSENDVDRRYAVKSLEVARSELKRSAEANQLHADSVSLTEIERLQLLVDRSSLSIEQAQRDRKVAVTTERIKDWAANAADLRLDHRQLNAPMDGMVVEIFTAEGEWLNPGDPVLRLIKLDRLRVEAHLDGKKHGRELQGTAVQLTVTLPPDERTETYRGKIVFVSPELQPVTGQVRVWAEVDNHDLQLRPGDHGELTIYVPQMPRDVAASVEGR